MKRLLWILVPVGVFFAVGCTDTNDLGNVEHVRTWANTASALAVYQTAFEPIAFVDGETTFPDAACPTVTDDGTTATITGGCSETDGTMWYGSATVVRTTNGGRSVTFDGYGSVSGDETLVRTTGTFALVTVSATDHTFDAELVRSGGTTTSYDYVGRVQGTYGTETVWNGNGTVTRDGPLAPIGTVEASTVDQRRNDDVCAGQSLSGTTTLDADERTAVITYDGATDCDADEDAEWSLDGVAQGSVTGILCSVSAVGASASSSLLFVAAAVVFVFMRRRMR